MTWARVWYARASRFLAGCAGIVLSGHAWAGPPYVSDDPEPTDYQHYEIYFFTEGVSGRSGSRGEAGIDFNYGALKDLQLTAVIPVDHAHPTGGRTIAAVGNIELAAKYRFLHRDDFGWDVAVFPRLFLPSASTNIGERHYSLLLPLWLERDWSQWSMFGGAGCEINRGDRSKDFCVAGWVLTDQVLPNVQFGAELVHQTADTRGGSSSTRVGAGVRYDINDKYHFLAYAGPSLQNIGESGRYAWYASILWSF